MKKAEQNPRDGYWYEKGRKEAHMTMLIYFKEFVENEYDKAKQLEEMYKKLATKGKKND